MAYVYVHFMNTAYEYVTELHLHMVMHVAFYFFLK